MAGRKFNRSELLDLVWSAPMRSIAANLGVSDVGLRKLVVKAKLPIPPQGYWNRVKAGKRVEPKPALPPRGFGASDEVYLGPDRWARSATPISDTPPPLEPSFDETIESVRRRAEKAIGKHSASRDLAVCHPTIRQVLNDEQGRLEKAKDLHPSLISFYGPRFDNPVDQRRLRLLNSICLGVAKAGLQVRLASKEDLTFQATSDLASISFTARKVTQTGKSAHADKRLSILLETNSQNRAPLARWDDADGPRLEAMVGKIATELAVLVEVRYREQLLENHRWHLQYRDAEIARIRKARLEAEQRERERKERLERERVELLLADANHLRHAQIIRAYVIEVESLCDRNSPEAVDAFDRWRAWALEQADRIDPVRNGSFSRFLAGQAAPAPE